MKTNSRFNGGSTVQRSRERMKERKRVRQREWLDRKIGGSKRREEELRYVRNTPLPKPSLSDIEGGKSKPMASFLHEVGWAEADAFVSAEASTGQHVAEAALTHLAKRMKMKDKIEKSEASLEFIEAQGDDEEKVFAHAIAPVLGELSERQAPVGYRTAFNTLAAGVSGPLSVSLAEFGQSLISDLRDQARKGSGKAEMLNSTVEAGSQVLSAILYEGDRHAEELVRLCDGVVAEARTSEKAIEAMDMALGFIANETCDGDAVESFRSYYELE